MTAWLTVVGIGEDGMAGLGDAARAVLEEAGIIFGGQRHLDMLLPHLGAERRPWPSPFAAAFDQVMALRGRPVCVLASGDPMFYGMGASLARLVPAAEMRVLPSPSSFSLAAARMGWPLQETTLLTIHGRPIETLHPHVHDGARLLVLSHDGSSAAAIAALLSGRGFGPSMLDALEHLGGVAERRLTGAASEWPHGETALLNIVAVECRAGAIVQEFSTLAGLPDEAYRHDGQLTKRDVRAVVLARLAPSPGELLWDVGAGCGSIGIEWMRAHPSCHAIAVEADPGRQELIRANSLALGVPGLRLVVGQAPEALAGLESPDAIFIGGGVTDPGVFDRCWAGLRPGGRLIANAVTVQSEMMLVSLRERVGGELTRIAVAQARPLGGFDAWRSALPVTVFSACKPGHLIG